MLTVRQEAFCLHYAKSGNATESYKSAGYQCKNDPTAAVMANRLLKNDNIKNRLHEIAEEMASDKIADATEIQERLTAILRMQTKEEQIVVEGCGDGVSEARTMDTLPRLKDVIKAGELLAKMQGAFDNSLKVEMTIPVFNGEDELVD